MEPGKDTTKLVFWSVTVEQWLPYVVMVGEDPQHSLSKSGLFLQKEKMQRLNNAEENH